MAIANSYTSVQILLSSVQPSESSLAIGVRGEQPPFRLTNLGLPNLCRGRREAPPEVQVPRAHVLLDGSMLYSRGKQRAALRSGSPQLCAGALQPYLLLDEVVHVYSFYFIGSDPTHPHVVFE